MDYRFNGEELDRIQAGSVLVDAWEGCIGCYPITGKGDVPPTSEKKPYVAVHSSDGRSIVSLRLSARDARKLGAALLLGAEDVKDAEAQYVAIHREES